MPRPRAHGDSTKRGAILDAAGELLRSRGFDGMAIEGVAALAGVSKTTVYAHFPDKLALFNAVMAKTAAAGVESESSVAGRDSDDPVVALAATLYEIVRSATTPELIAFFRVLITEQDQREQLRGLLEDARRSAGAPSIVSMLVPRLQALADARSITIEAPEKWSIVLLRMAAPALQFDMLTHEFTPDDGLVRTHVDLVVGLVAAGLAAAPDGVARLPADYDRYPWGPAFEP